MSYYAEVHKGGVGMRRLILIIGLILALSGCATYYTYVLPTNYNSEVEGVLSHFNKLNLKNKYSVKILSKEEMERVVKSGSPAIDKNTIYFDDLYLKYLYGQKNSLFYHIRKKDLACIIAHEICHTEYDLPTQPLEKHFEVDKAAINMLRNFGIDWVDYFGALARVNNYLQTRGGDFANFLKQAAWWTGTLTVGIGLFETDIPTRYMMVIQYYGGSQWYRESDKRTKVDFSRKVDWEFPVK